MPSSPEATVLIPTRNRWKLLARTLAGALAQEDVGLEVLVVDDGSTDGTSERLLEIGDPRVRHVRHERSRGVTRARNHGLELARGEWIAFLDDDDLWSPRKLREQIDAADAQHATFVYSAAAQLEGDRVREINEAPRAEDTRTEILRRCVIPSGCSNVMVARDSIQAVSGFDERLRMMADWDLWIRLTQAGVPADCPQTHVAYVIHDSNMHGDQAAGHIEELAYIEEKFRAERGAKGVEIDGVAFTRWIGGAARRGGDWGAAARIYMYGATRYRSLGNIGRAGAALLHIRARTGRSHTSADPPPEPSWLDLYRPGGAVHAAASRYAELGERSSR